MSCRLGYCNHVITYCIHMHGHEFINVNIYNMRRYSVNLSQLQQFSWMAPPSKILPRRSSASRRETWQGPGAPGRGTPPAAESRLQLASKGSRFFKGKAPPAFHSPSSDLFNTFETSFMDPSFGLFCFVSRKGSTAASRGASFWRGLKKMVKRGK